MTVVNQFSLFTGGLCLGMLIMSLYSSQDASHSVTHNRHVARSIADSSTVLQFGHPGPVHDLLERDSYISSYNRRDRIPDWVGEHLTAESITKGDGVDRGKSNFQEDPSIPLLYRGLLNDYRSSGYDRGHMAPAGDAVSTQEAMDQTFYLSNMCPQVGVGFNRNYWAYFEAFCRSLTASYTDVYVYTGPLFLPQSSSSKTAGKSDYTVTYKMLGDVPNIAVPTHFYKVILIPNANGYAAAAFVLPNASINSKTALTSFQVKLEVIEKASGLQFFSKLDRSTFTDLCTLTTCTV